MPTRLFDYCTTVNGVKHEYRLHILADLAALCSCPVCGLADCGNEQFLWAELNHEKQAIRFGGDTFGTFLERWHHAGITAEDYQKLPEFIKEDNECRGWADAASPNVRIDAPDFSWALEVIKSSRHTQDDDDFSQHYYPALKSFTDRVISENRTLNLLR